MVTMAGTCTTRKGLHPDCQPPPISSWPVIKNHAKQKRTLCQIHSMHMVTEHTNVT
jgi:hypothetical protein